MSSSIAYPSFEDSGKGGGASNGYPSTSAGGYGSLPSTTGGYGSFPPTTGYGSLPSSSGGYG